MFKTFATAAIALIAQTSATTVVSESHLDTFALTDLDKKTTKKKEETVAELFRKVKKDYEDIKSTLESTKASRRVYRKNKAALRRAIAKEEKNSKQLNALLARKMRNANKFLSKKNKKATKAAAATKPAAAAAKAAPKKK